MRDAVLTPAVVLSRRNFKGADKLVVFFTEKLGKIIAKAKGARRIKSKLAGHLEPFSLISIRLIKKNDFYTVVEVATENSFQNIRSNLKQTAGAFYVAELLSLLSAFDDPHPEVFKLLKTTLKLIDSGKNGKILSAFLWHLINKIGYRFDLKACESCSEKSSRYSFNPVQNKISCLVHKPSESGVSVSAGAIKLLRIAQADLTLFARVRANQRDIRSFERVVALAAETIIEREVKSRKMLEEVGA